MNFGALRMKEDFHHTKVAIKAFSAMLSGLKSWGVSPLRRTSIRQSPIHAVVMQLSPASNAAGPSGQPGNPSPSIAPTGKSHTSRRSQSRGQSLTKVPGVGPKYEALLRGRGLTSVPDLVHLYQTHGEEAGRYLQVIGIHQLCSLCFTLHGLHIFPCHYSGLPHASL